MDLCNKSYLHLLSTSPFIFSLSLSLSCCCLIPFWAGQLLRPAGFKLDLQHCSETLLVLACHKARDYLTKPYVPTFIESLINFIRCD